MEQYISKEFPDGASVEAALLRAKSGGAIDITLQNKASAGFGFGGETLSEISVSNASESYESFCSKVDAVLATMRYKSVKMILAYPPEIYGYGTTPCILYKGSNDYAGLYSVSSYNEAPFGFRMIKYKIYSSEPTGKWQPFEWVNPPMTLGVEYRTTERRNGLPVYTQFNNLGKIVNGAYGDISVTNLDSVVGYEAFWVNRPLPIIKNSSLTDAETQYLNVYVLNANTIRVYYYGGTSVSGNGDVYVLVKYTKST